MRTGASDQQCVRSWSYESIRALGAIRSTGLARSLCALQAAPCAQGASSALHSGLGNRQHWWIRSWSLLPGRLRERLFRYSEEISEPGFELGTCSWEHLLTNIYRDLDNQTSQ
jgi:hypothetical protein